MNPTKILCPIDFSDNSRAALELATHAAQRHNAKLYIVHVENARQQARPGSSAYLAELDEHKRLLREGRPTIEHVDFEQHYLRGEIADEIVRFADAREVDQIIVGTHGRTGIYKALLGSVAEAIVRHANCEVITVPLHSSATQ